MRGAPEALSTRGGFRLAGNCSGVDRKASVEPTVGGWGGLFVDP